MQHGRLEPKMGEQKPNSAPCSSAIHKKMVPVEEPAPPFIAVPMPTPEAPKPNFIELAVEGIKRVGSGTFDGAMAIGAATVNGVKFVGGGVGAGGRGNGSKFAIELRNCFV